MTPTYPGSFLHPALQHATKNAPFGSGRGGFPTHCMGSPICFHAAVSFVSPPQGEKKPSVSKEKFTGTAVHLLGSGWDLGKGCCQRPHEHWPLALGATVAAVEMGLCHDPVLREHLQICGCPGIGHGKIQEQPRLLTSIPESHWNVVPEYTEPEGLGFYAILLLFFF